MRIFVGIKASEELQQKISKWQKEYKDLPARLIRPENLQLTLIPPWYEDDPKEAIAILKSIKYKSFRITFSRIVINFRSQVIWTEPTKSPEEIFSVANDLRKLFKVKDTRPYRPHLTIARFKDGRLLQDVRFKEIKWEEEIDNITLFESILTSKEAKYRKIFSI